MTCRRGVRGELYIAQWSCNSIATLWEMQAGRENGGTIDSWPLQDILSVGGFCARINHPFIPRVRLALPTLVQYHCTAVWRYTTPPPTSRFHAIHHTILVTTIVVTTG